MTNESSNHALQKRENDRKRLQEEVERVQSGNTSMNLRDIANLLHSVGDIGEDRGAIDLDVRIQLIGDKMRALSYLGHCIKNLGNLTPETIEECLRKIRERLILLMNQYKQSKTDL